jgi:hypothetical protein
MITAVASLASSVIMDCRHEAGNDKLESRNELSPNPL